MKLRDHPGMTYHGIPNWPPVWTKGGEQSIIKLQGEIGFLEYVFANERISNKCFLVIRHEGERYVGALIFNERPLCERITRLLRQQVGKTIADIGDLDVSQTL